MAYIVSAKRTAVGNFMGSFKSTPSVDLGTNVVKAIMAETKVPHDAVNEVIMGEILTGGLGQNTARQVTLNSGLNQKTVAYTLNRVCGSGLQSVISAAQSIMLKDSDIIIAGGQENMTLSSHVCYVRAGVKMGSAQFEDSMIRDGLTDVFSQKHMGITAENIANRFGITREMQDEFAHNSQVKAARAQAAGKFKKEIVPVNIKVKKEDVPFAHDEFIKTDSSLEKFAALRPAFDKNGTVTAGNASGINDGAAALMVVSEAALKKYNLKPIARVVSYGCAGVDPDIMGTGPVPASRLAIAKANWQLDDIDLIEANEAFAAQAAYVNKEMKWDVNKVNVNGGAIAIGHPIGASGARILVTLLHALEDRKLKKGLATLCIGGGMGIALCVEMC